MNEKRQSGYEGYMTAEAAMIFPMIFALIIMLLYATFFLYDKCRMTQDLYTAAYRKSIVRSERIDFPKPDTSGYFMLRSCEAEVINGSGIQASASGEMAPALLTGTEKDAELWKIKVTMEARKTDPPYSFRKFRRITAITQQVLAAAK